MRLYQDSLRTFPQRFNANCCHRDLDCACKMAAFN
jgi:hypothetical protein